MADQCAGEVSEERRGEHASDLPRILPFTPYSPCCTTLFPPLLLGRTGAGDVFTGRLLALLKEVLAENGGAPPQPIYFGIHRSDYMIDGGQSGTEAELRQIELNTISSAFAGLSSKIAELHKYLAQRFPAVYAANGLAAAALPPNACLISVAAAIAEAHKAYGKPE